MTKPARFPVMLAYLKGNAKTDDDKELIALFEKHTKDVSEHFENCLPEAPHWEGMWNPEIISRADWHGPGFHKGFRQYDVTSDSKDDMRIWKLLGDGDTCFWDAHNVSMEASLTDIVSDASKQLSSTSKDHGKN